MSDKGYILKIKQTNMPRPYKNNRKIIVSAYLSCTDLHNIIQIIYGLENYHLWNMTNHKTKPTREVMPGSEDEYYPSEHEILNPDNVLLAQFISKKYKKIYYTYDFGVCTNFTIEYQGLTSLSDIKLGKCVEYEGFNIIEDVPIWQQTELMEIYQDKNKKELKESFDWFDSRKIFEKWISYAFCPVDLDKVNQTITKIKISN